MDSTLLLIYENLKQAALLSNALMLVAPEINLCFAESSESVLRCPIPGMILLDLDSPSSFAILKWLRHHESHRAIPVVAATSSLEPGDANRAYELGANVCVLKIQGDLALEVARGIGTYLRALKDRRLVA